LPLYLLARFTFGGKVRFCGSQVKRFSAADGNWPVFT